MFSAFPTPQDAVRGERYNRNSLVIALRDELFDILHSEERGIDSIGFLFLPRELEAPR